MANGNLPGGWERTKIGEIVNFEYGKSLTSAKRDQTGSVPVYGSNGIVGYHSSALIDKPCLIIGRKGAAGEVHKSEVPCWPIDTTYYAIPPKNINLSFLYYLFTSLDFPSLDRSTAIPGLNRNDAYAVEIPLPPLPEQEQIVSRIEKLFSDLDAGVAALERIRAGLKRYKASVLKAAVNGELLNGKSGIGDSKLPEGWSWKSSSEFCIAVESGSTPKAELMISGKGEVPFIKVYNLSFDGALDFTVKPTFVSKKTQNIKLKRSKVYPGDVLTNIVGPPLGKVSVVPNIYPEWNINQAVVLFRTGNTVDNIYLSIVLQSPDFLKRIKATAKATAGQYNVSLTTCRTILMPIPPLDEQRSIVAEVERRLSVVSEVEFAVEAGLAHRGETKAVCAEVRVCGEVMMIFDSSPMNVMRQKYRDFPNYEVPEVVFLDRFDDYEGERDLLEDLVGRVRGQKQKDWISRLLSEDPSQHIGAWFEIMLYGWLFDHFEVLVEPEILGNYPDFILHNLDPQLAIEARAFLVSPEERERHQKINRIFTSLGNIQRPFSISLKISHLGDKIAIDDFVEKVIHWLDSVANQEFDYQDDHKNVIHLSAAPMPTGKKLGVINSEGFAVNPEVLKAPLREKAAQHKALRKAGYPYVIAVFLEPSQLSAEEVSEAWLGKLSVVYDVDTDQVVEENFNQSGVHYFGKEIVYKSVTGTLVFKAKYNEASKSRYLQSWYMQNPYANVKVDPAIFSTQARFVVVGQDDKAFDMRWVR